MTRHEFVTKALKGGWLETDPKIAKQYPKQPIEDIADIQLNLRGDTLFLEYDAWLAVAKIEKWDEACAVCGIERKYLKKYHSITEGHRGTLDPAHNKMLRMVDAIVKNRGITKYLLSL